MINVKSTSTANKKGSFFKKFAANFIRFTICLMFALSSQIITQFEFLILIKGMFRKISFHILHFGEEVN